MKKFSKDLLEHENHKTEALPLNVPGYQLKEFGKVFSLCPLIEFHLAVCCF